MSSAGPSWSHLIVHLPRQTGRWRLYRNGRIVVVVDVHAEATSEKLALGWYLDGRASAVLGTHTHVQTADERIFPQGTAYITDVGMTGPRDSILGVKVEPVIARFRTGMPHRFELAAGPVVLERSGGRYRRSYRNGTRSIAHRRTCTSRAVALPVFWGEIRSTTRSSRLHHWR